MRPQRPLLTSLSRGLAWILGAALLLAAAVKLAGFDAVAQKFRDWGYPDGVSVVVAIMELTAALMLYSPPAARPGAALGMAIMGGAVATHLSAGEYGLAGLPVLMGVGLLWVAVAEPKAPHLHGEPQQTRPRSTGAS